MSKIDDIIDIAIKNDVGLIIHGGDFFDSPRIDYWLLNAIIKRFQKLQEYNVLFYIVPGSHDMYGYNIESLHSTAVGTLVEAGLVRVLNGKLTIGNIVFYGIPATLDHNISLYSGLERRAVVISHNMLTPQGVPYAHILLKDVPVNNNLFLTGHYHQYFMIKEKDNVFINTGPVIRTDISEGAHVPCVVLLDFADKVSIKKVDISRVKKNVFNTDVTTHEPINFVNSLQSTKFVFCDIFDLTKQIGKELKVEDTIITEAINRLEKVQREIL
jgi:DNA repair exonuclease SbcCD nuclease subunit